VLSWTEPIVPRLPGTAPIPRVFDDSTGTLIAATPVDGRVGLYVCGITPYDATHLGHASTYVAFDTLYRAWLDAGLGVDYAQNVTDVDDPLLERATATGVDWRELAASQTDLFRSDMAALRVIPPFEYTAVTDVVGPISEAVAKLVSLGFAYEVPTPDALNPGSSDLYFDVDAASASTSWHLGFESRLDASTMMEHFTERGGDPLRVGKRNAFDPLLWRVAREGEPSWPSPVGEGRPGWHIECSVIALDALGTSFAVQGGGSDLVFPHHEFSAAHATALTGSSFAEVYAHSGMVAYQGEKMSKSLGNLVLVSGLRAEDVDAGAVRLAVLEHHYRSDWEWTDAGLASSVDRLAAWQAVLAPATPPVFAGDVDSFNGAESELALLGRLRAHLANDLDTPAALAEIDAWILTLPTTTDLIRRAVDALLGVAL
jgi:L-cysteine:1D-myo-inositol 2-amino-2-deoxy-alpha-D-glucopyranoside ligase